MHTTIKDKKEFGFLLIIMALLFLSGLSIGMLFRNETYYYLKSEYQGPEMDIRIYYPNASRVGIAFRYQFTIDPHEAGWREWMEYRDLMVVENDTGHFEQGLLWIEMEPPEILQWVTIENAYVIGYTGSVVTNFRWDYTRVNGTYFTYYANIWLGALNETG